MRFYHYWLFRWNGDLYKLELTAAWFRDASVSLTDAALAWHGGGSHRSLVFDSVQALEEVVMEEEDEESGEVCPRKKSANGDASHVRGL